ncbi:hypothetical protein AB6N24_01770 [Cellulomonas sp. 179-A 4D5 NHS]|uniref:hypothetical protein n=1 Tax=Cellulomonas sp. 179-A 4D5 NHS TaxID=3142378 RepID=UPI0039A04E23
MSTDPSFHDVPFDELEPERLVPTLLGLGLALQPQLDARDDVRGTGLQAPAE